MYLAKTGAVPACASIVLRRLFRNLQLVNAQNLMAGVHSMRQLPSSLGKERSRIRDGLHAYLIYLNTEVLGTTTLTRGHGGTSENVA